MFITNTTDMARNTGVKVIGIGEFQIMPGETKEVPDKVAYCMVDGKKTVLPALTALERTHQIRIEKEFVPSKAEEEPAAEEPVEEPTAEEPVEEPPEEKPAEEKPKKGGRGKKAE